MSRYVFPPPGTKPHFLSPHREDREPYGPPFGDGVVRSVVSGGPTWEWYHARGGGISCCHGYSWPLHYGIPCWQCTKTDPAPKAPPDLIRPDYWQPFTITMYGLTFHDGPDPRPEPGPHLRCTFHDRVFAADEACWLCLSNDDDDEIDPEAE